MVAQIAEVARRSDARILGRMPECLLAALEMERLAHEYLSHANTSETPIEALDRICEPYAGIHMTWIAPDDVGAFSVSLVPAADAPLGRLILEALRDDLMSNLDFFRPLVEQDCDEDDPDWQEAFDYWSEKLWTPFHQRYSFSDHGISGSA